ncbi:hypothetical protein SCG7086_BN_00030 [Chlamydiales bacterium SCGC AG-110-P3]|nr:hypothetical protein SCG7086_BN_00030 [Chlamydiales bacterium SCGC AG-110-P3]
MGYLPSLLAIGVIQMFAVATPGLGQIELDSM